MVAFLLSADAASAPGATSIAPVRIDCAALDGESRSALEARTRAEIALLPQPAGTVVVTCRERNARIEWLPATAGPVRQRAVALEGPNDAVAVDRLLDAIHELRAGLDATRAAPAARMTTVPTPAVAGTSADVSGIAAVRSTRRLRMGVVAAARAELWEGAIAGGVAGELGLRLATRTGWSVTAAAALGGGAQTARGIQASMFVASIAGQHPILELARARNRWRVAADRCHRRLRRRARRTARRHLRRVRGPPVRAVARSVVVRRGAGSGRAGHADRGRRRRRRAVPHPTPGRRPVAVRRRRHPSLTEHTEPAAADARFTSPARSASPS